MDFLNSYSWLANRSERTGTFTCKITPKFHYWQHIVEEALRTRRNPRENQCFADEDMIGKMLKVCAMLRDVTFATRFFDRHRLFLIGAWPKRAQQARG